MSSEAAHLMVLEKQWAEGARVRNWGSNEVLVTNFLQLDSTFLICLFSPNKEKDRGPASNMWDIRRYFTINDNNRAPKIIYCGMWYRKISIGFSERFFFLLAYLFTANIYLLSFTIFVYLSLITYLSPKINHPSSIYQLYIYHLYIDISRKTAIYFHKEIRLCSYNLWNVYSLNSLHIQQILSLDII